MIRVYWIRFCNKNEELIVREDYYGKTYKSMDNANRFVFKECKRLEEEQGIELKVDAYMREIPQIKQINDVAGLVCRYLEQPREGVMSKIKKREFAYARKFISNICLDMGHTHNVIAGETGFDRGSVYSHQKSLRNLRETDKAMNKDYVDISHLVRKELNGVYNIDGSGKKLEA